MQTQYTKEEDCTECVTCVYSVDEVNSAFEKAIKMFSSSLHMDGFRKGKVPHSIVEQRMGDDVLFKVAEILSHPVYKEVDKKKGILLSSGLSPKGETDKDLVLPKKNEEYTVQYTYRCVPEVELPPYDDVKKELNIEPVSEEEVDKAILELVRQTALLEESSNENPADGDVAVISLTLKENGILLGQQAEYKYPLPCENFLQPLQDTIRTMKKGEKKEVVIAFPNIGTLEKASIVSGKTCDVTIELLQILSVPQLANDSELLKKMGYDSYSEFKEAYRNLLLEYKTASAKTELQRDIVSSIANRVECEIPSSLIDLYKDAVLDNFESISASQGFSVNLFASEFKHLASMAEDLAKDMAKGQVVLLNIAKQENIAVNDTEFATFIQQLAERAGMEATKLYEEYREADMLLVLYQRLLADKMSLLLYKKVVENQDISNPQKQEQKKGQKKNTKELENKEK